MSQKPEKKKPGVKLVSKVRVSESLTIEVLQSRSPQERKRLLEERKKLQEEEKNDE